MRNQSKTYLGRTLLEWRESGIGVVHRALNGYPNRAAILGDMMRGMDFDFVVPDNLLLLSGHNFDEPTLYEEQMNYHRVPSKAYKIIRVKTETPWTAFLWWKSGLAYLKSKEAEKKDYVIFSDPTDTVFIDSPHNILNNFLIKFNCESLYNSTVYRRGYRWDKHSEESKAYHSAKARRLARGGPPRLSKHLNAGLFIGKKDFVIEMYEDILSHEFDSKGERDESNWEKSPEFPYGCADDQKTLRHLEYKYHPKMQIDGKNKLFIRCN